MNRVLLPAGWPQPKGYSNGIAAEGTIVSVAGQVGWTPDGQWQTDDFGEQARQALSNLMAVLREAGAGPEHVVRMTWYVTDKREYLAAAKSLGAAYRELMRGTDGKVNYPAMTAVQVVALIEDRAKVEIEATAVVPRAA
ncbi:MAG TPA: RidA family protein [Burkholderiaceae bacterium]|jgi:enamine deaminase RidA (YjgF/YER057c/UK114 family)|nr:RidA family protein [Burkholderiaceae bacterium]